MLNIGAVQSKQCRPRSDAAERGIWPGSTLFATQSVLNILTGSKMNLFKFKTRMIRNYKVS